MQRFQPALAVRQLLLPILGPTIWMAHFLAIYIVNALACARPGSLLAQHAGPLPVSSWLIVAASVAALAALTATAALAQRQRAHGYNDAPASARFRAWLTGALCLLSGLAVVWQTVPVFLVTACG
ncbi:hypothetical protein [Achromobacter piechaudii]|uniref:Uncharacterized protein n=1 Tax=Achromobacter piechaudii TaxID=72556 RepID=A0ABN7EYB1_9BURK|nr:hypothetical protein [Achromobacter piechaudii]CAB3684708.1 hypothetical protein LMG1873_01783 [Achromobacter piechaudii]CAB3868137.1 hypothetical protein LMG2828_02837 [Achromobacter piechaudii]CAB3948459.1 hypothetical protein LMG6103_01903 [Achromobacter piechaudii]